MPSDLNTKLSSELLSNRTETETRGHGDTGREKTSQDGRITSLKETQDQLSESPLQDAEPSPKISHSPSRRKWFWVLPLGLIMFGGIVVANQLGNSPPEPPTVIKALPVTTTPVQQVDQYQVQRTYTGELVPRRRSDLGFERGGTVVNLTVDEGDRVSQGQALATLDTRSLEAEYKALKAQWEQGKAQLQELQTGPRPEDIAAARAIVADIDNQLQLARLRTDRRGNLYREGAISQEQLDQEIYNTGSLESRLQQAQSNLDELLAGTRQEQITAQGARVQQLEANLQGIEVELSKSVIRAPFNGMISDRALDEGAVVGNGRTVFTLVEQDYLEAHIGVSSDQTELLTLGKSYPIEMGTQVYEGTLTGLLPELEETSRTVTAIFTLPKSVALRVGQTARLLLSETQDVEGFWLPSTALIPRERGLWSVYVLGEETSEAGIYTVGRREVEVLHTDGEQVLVRGTLEEDNTVITSGTHRIVSGQRVSVNGL